MMLRYDKKLNNCESVNKLPGVPRRRGTTCGWSEGREWPQAATANTDDCSGGDPPPTSHNRGGQPGRTPPTRGVPITVNNII